MKKSIYKYNIRHHFSTFQVGDKRITWEQFEQFAFAEAGISKTTCQRDRNILLTDDEDITGERLAAYAKILRVPVEKLFNYKSDAKPFKK